MNTTLGKRISSLRREKGLKQEDLAEKLGISAQAVSKWETEQTCPDISLLPQLAKILGVSVDELLTGEKKELSALRILPEDERKNIEDRMLRVVVKSSRGDIIRLNLPIAVIEVAIDSGLDMSQIFGNEALKRVDMNKIMGMVRQGIIGNIIEVESAEGDTVSIFAE